MSFATPKPLLCVILGSLGPPEASPDRILWVVQTSFWTHKVGERQDSVTPHLLLICFLFIALRHDGVYLRPLARVSGTSGSTM